jgi:hypothetical protein
MGYEIDLFYTVAFIQISDEVCQVIASQAYVAPPELTVIRSGSACGQLLNSPGNFLGTLPKPLVAGEVKTR